MRSSLRLLADAYADYASAFESDRNHFYSGLNALAMATLIIELAESLPAVWAAAYPSDSDAADAMRRLKAQAERLRVAVDLAIDGKHRQLDFRRETDEWVDIAAADLAFLSPASTPERVADRYGKALERAQLFHIDSARRQVEIFRKLGLRVDRAAAAWAEMEAAMARVRPAAVVDGVARVLLFTGHRVDAPGREKPRFPSSSVDWARTMIDRAIDEEAAAAGGALVGLAGGASGGDILFHEACSRRGIRSELFLLGSRDAYVSASVQDSGPEWVARFDALMSTRPARVCSATRRSR